MMIIEFVVLLFGFQSQKNLLYQFFLLVKEEILFILSRKHSVHLMIITKNKPKNREKKTFLHFSMFKKHERNFRMNVF